MAFAALGAFGRLLVDLYKEAAADAAGLGEGAFPACPIAVGVVGAAVEGAALAGFLFDDFAAVFGAADADLDQNLLRVAAAREIAATDEAAEPPLAADRPAARARSRSGEVAPPYAPCGQATGESPDSDLRRGPFPARWIAYADF